MSRSYDGGLTWSGAFLPGAPFDQSPASLASPVYGLQAATDPVLAPGPCGKFYVVFMAFTRGDESKLVVARYQDLNNPRGRRSHRLPGDDGRRVGQQRHQRLLPRQARHRGRHLPRRRRRHLRRPGLRQLLDLQRSRQRRQVPEQGQLSPAPSTAGSPSTHQKLNPPYKQNQGSALAVDPRKRRHLHDLAPLLRRRMRVLMVKILDSGEMVAETESWSPTDMPMAAIRPAEHLASTTRWPQAATSPQNPGFPEVRLPLQRLSHRRVTGDGTIFAAWQERVRTLTAARSSTGGRRESCVVRSAQPTAAHLDGRQRRPRPPGGGHAA